MVWKATNLMASVDGTDTSQTANARKKLERKMEIIVENGKNRWTWSAEWPKSHWAIGIVRKECAGLAMGTSTTIADDYTAILQRPTVYPCKLLYQHDWATQKMPNQQPREHFLVSRYTRWLSICCYYHRPNFQCNISFSCDNRASNISFLSK